MTTKLEIIGNAFVELGEPAPTDLNVPNENEFVDAAVTLYETFIDWAFSGYDWKFATVIVDLVVSVTPTPLPDTFRIVYDLPIDMLRLTRLEPFPQQKYEIIGNLLLSNQEDVKIVYVRRVLEPEFPAYFTAMAQAGMSAKLARVVTSDEAVVATQKQEFAEEFIQAKSRDSRIQPNVPLLDDPLTRARRSNGFPI